MPVPLMPWNGLGMNVAYRPCCWAIAFSVVRNVTALSAVRMRVVVLEVDLVLADRDLVVAGLDDDPQLFERLDHLLADVGRLVRRQVEVARLVVRQRLDVG